MPADGLKEDFLKIISCLLELFTTLDTGISEYLLAINFKIRSFTSLNMNLSEAQVMYIAPAHLLIN